MFSDYGIMKKWKETKNMVCKCLPIEYGRSDETFISEDEFFAEHESLKLTSAQIDRLKQNLEQQCILVLKEYGTRNRLIRTEFNRTFIYQDESTMELYLKPLEIDVRVFFRKQELILLIYDMRMGSEV